MRIALSLIILITVISLPSAFGQDRFRAKDPPRSLLENLKRGNARFISGQLIHPHTDAERRTLSAERNPDLYTFATILSCTDPRVPVELIFDLGIMDACVIRTPGNSCGKREIEAIDYSAKHYSTPLIIIMGHNECELIKAALNEEAANDLPASIIDFVKPVRKLVDRVREENPHLRGKALANQCVEEHVMESIRALFDNSPYILEKTEQSKILVVGAVYDIKSGKVDWINHRRIWNLMRTISAEKGKSK